MTYFNHDEIVTGMHLLADSYKDYCKLIQLPCASVESRDIYALAVGDNLGPNVKTAIYVGGVHAREWVPPDALFYLVADLLEARTATTGITYKTARITAAEIQQIFSQLQLVILPCANPDGRVYSQEVDHCWRKNRSYNRSPGRLISRGVDLNRNFDIAWDFRNIFASTVRVASSDNPSHKDTYVGPKAASEPETRNIAWLLDEYPNAGWYIDVHSYGPAIFFPWGIDDWQNEDPKMTFMNSSFDGKRGIACDVTYREFMPASDLLEHRRLAYVMADEIRKVRCEDYRVSASFSLYPTSGTSKDYAYSRHLTDATKKKVLAFTFECGSAFRPDFDEAATVMLEVSAALARFAVEVSR